MENYGLTRREMVQAKRGDDARHIQPRRFEIVLRKPLATHNQNGAACRAYEDPRLRSASKTPKLGGRASSGSQQHRRVSFKGNPAAAHHHLQHGQQQEGGEVFMELATPAPSRDVNTRRVTHRRDGLRVRAGTGRDVAARTFSLVLKVVPPSMRKNNDDDGDDDDHYHRQQQRLTPSAAAATMGSQDDASGIAAGSGGAGDSFAAAPNGAPGGSGGSVGNVTTTAAGPAAAAAAAVPAAVAAPRLALPPREHTPRLGAREPRVNFTADLEDDEDVNATLNAIAGGGVKPGHRGGGYDNNGRHSLGCFAAANAVDARRVSAAPDVIHIDTTPGGAGAAGRLGAATPASAAGSDVMIPLVPYANSPESAGLALGGAGDRLGADADHLGADRLGADAEGARGADWGGAAPRSAPGTGASAYELAGAGARAVAITPGFTPDGRPVLRVGNRTVKDAEAAAVAGRADAVNPTPANTPWCGVAAGPDDEDGNTPRGTGGAGGGGVAGRLGAVTPGYEGLAPGEPIEDEEDGEEAPGSAVTVSVSVHEDVVEEGGAMRCSRGPGADEPPLVDVVDDVGAGGDADGNFGDGNFGDGDGDGDDDNDFGGGFDAGMDDADAFFGDGGQTPAAGARGAGGEGGGVMVDGGNDPMTGGLDAVGGKKRKRAAGGPQKPRGTPNKLERARYQRRKSLATAGMRDDLETEDGRPVRRSTRERTRPLEYWRGEKKSYCRSHLSLPTVKAVATRTPNPSWPMAKTPHSGDKVHGNKKRGGGGGAASRKAGEEARRRALALADVAHLSDSDEEEEEEEEESEGDEEEDFVSLAKYQRKAVGR